MKDKIRIAAGQGFWGDWLEAPVRQVEGGPIDYLMMDYLAEVTMSILQKQKERDPKMGYARDVVPLLQRILPKVVERNIRVTTNAGGVNPVACAVAGHINEAGAQCSGGNYLAGWPNVQDLENVGYPVIEAAADGTFEVMKHPDTGGAITVESVTEQLLYEMGDPKNYITPDCV